VVELQWAMENVCNEVRVFRRIEEVVPVFEEVVSSDGGAGACTGAGTEAELRTVFWVPESPKFPTVDLLVARGAEVLLVSATTSRRHSLVWKCVLDRGPDKGIGTGAGTGKGKGSRRDRSGKPVYGGLLPLSQALRSNGFPLRPLRFLWVVPTPLCADWRESLLSAADRRLSSRYEGLALMSRQERGGLEGEERNLQQLLLCLPWNQEIIGEQGNQVGQGVDGNPLAALSTTTPA
jgi:hypothetical protein